MNHINTQEYMTDEYDEGEILYIVGIDPGTDTGIAVKDLNEVRKDIKEAYERRCGMCRTR